MSTEGAHLVKRKIESVLIGALIAVLAFSLGFFFGRRSFTGLHIDAGRTAAEPALDPTALAAAESESSAQALLPAGRNETGERINLNTATLEELMTLPGIGETKAQRILDYRAQVGGFTSVSELTNVEGIGSKTLDGLLDYITLE